MDVDLSPLARTISVAIGKGGAGKTSLTANLAGLTAQAGYSVLAVSLDPQDNLGEDLGYSSLAPERGGSDDGQGLVEAIRGHAPLRPLKSVRENLDVIPGGDALEELVAELYVQRHQQAPEHALGLAKALLAVAVDYDLILIDCPPGYHILQHQALVASRWILVPTSADASSRKGIARLAQRVTEARGLNPDLGLLGVVIFDIPSRASRIRGRAAESIARSLGTSDALLTASIRTAKAAAHDARERGQLMHELTLTLTELGPWWRHKGQGMGEVSLARSATSVAEDYQQLAHELLARLSELEQQEEQP